MKIDATLHKMILNMLQHGMSKPEIARLAGISEQSLTILLTKNEKRIKLLARHPRERGDLESFDLTSCHLDSRFHAGMTGVSSYD